MTRWARANNVHRNKPAEATPWSQLRGRGSGGGARGDPLRKTQAGGSSSKNRKKKDYTNEDVNGFLEYLKESGAPPPAGRPEHQQEELVQEVEEALKRDTRRENRRVKRQNDKKNKMLCFNCRKPGHGLADCPEADADRDMGRGICYRCGSTEHEIHKCRAKVDPALGDYPYAKCFICGQTGHLSRSCPDNPKGLYAQGGSCRLCGSVEHFQKDCPEHQAARMNTAVREIRVSSQPGSSYFLRVDWKGRSLASGFRVLLTDGQDAWRGEVGEATVSGEAAELEMTMEKYIQDLERALTGAGEPDSYSFSLSPEAASGGVTLTYEKMQKEISFRLGSVLLEAELRPAEALRQLLLHSLQRGNGLQNQNQKLQEENQRLRGEQQRICAELQRYAGGKEALEAELYSRFVLVLNEKKAKIRHLQDGLSKLQEARNSDGQKSKSSERSTRSAEEEEDEYGGSTDEEEAPSSPTSTLPSRSSRPDSPLDDSLRDITDVAPSRKRRFRHLGQDPAGKRPDAEARQRERTGPPAGSSKLQTPQRSADAAAAEDLFEDF